MERNVVKRILGEYKKKKKEKEQYREEWEEQEKQKYPFKPVINVDYINSDRR